MQRSPEDYHLLERKVAGTDFLRARFFHETSFGHLCFRGGSLLLDPRNCCSSPPRPALQTGPEAEDHLPQESIVLSTEVFHLSRGPDLAPEASKETPQQEPQPEPEHPMVESVVLEQPILESIAFDNCAPRSQGGASAGPGSSWLCRPILE